MKKYLFILFLFFSKFSIAQYEGLDSLLLSTSVTYKEAAIHCVIPFEIGYSENKNKVRVLIWAKRIGIDRADTANGFVSVNYYDKTPVTTISMYFDNTMTAVMSFAPVLKNNSFSDELEFSLMYREHGEVFPKSTGRYKKERIFDQSNNFKERIISLEGIQIVITDKFILSQFLIGELNFLLLDKYIF